MKARILFLSDLHKRDKDFTSIKNYCKAVDQVQLDILNFVKANNITHLISLGDWYDKGYRTQSRTQNDRNLDEALKRSVNGNFYINIGNHFFLERDNNPEMYMIQPHPTLKPSKPVIAFEPVIKAVNKLRIGGLQISFFHYNKENKNYVADRDPDATYHIGLYHDESVVPSAARNKAGYFGDTSSMYLSSVLNNVDLAIVGHIHTPIGVEQLQINGRRVPMIIPGSLAITQNKQTELHTAVKLPVIEVEDDDSVKCSLYPFSLHADLLQFYEKAGGEKAITEVINLGAIEAPKTATLNEFLRAKGHNDRNIMLVKATNEGDVNTVEAMKILGLLITKPTTTEGGTANDSTGT